MIAAIAAKPQLLIADEPTTAVTVQRKLSSC
jgi:ABC-type glutathione transport system ATPase component